MSNSLIYEEIMNVKRKFNETIALDPALLDPTFIDYATGIVPPLRTTRKDVRSYTPQWMMRVRKPVKVTNFPQFMLHYEYGKRDIPVGDRIIGVSVDQRTTGSGWGKRLRAGCGYAFFTQAQHPPPMINVEGMATEDLQALKTAIQRELSTRQSPFVQQFMQVPYDPQPAAVDYAMLAREQAMMAELRAQRATGFRGHISVPTRF